MKSDFDFVLNPNPSLESQPLKEREQSHEKIPGEARASSLDKREQLPDLSESVGKKIEVAKGEALADSAPPVIPLLSLEMVAVKFEKRESRWKNSAFWALKDVNLTLNKGDALAVVGKNGAGKSTLLRLLAGIYKPDQGKVIKHRPFNASLLALNVGFAANLSGRENVILNAMLLGLSRQKAISLTEDIKTFSDLGDFFEQPVITYSTGMKARLGFSIAQYANPDILLLDEALGVGDKDFREKANVVIQEKLLHKDATVVLSSHSEGTLRKFCNRAIWLERGTIVRQGTVDEVLDSYLSRKEGARG